MSLNPNLVFIAFSDTHGDADKLTRLYTLIDKTIKDDHKQNPNIQHILLVPGDVFGVSALWSALSEGQFDIDGISKIAELFPENHRFFTPGNHDFYYGEKKLIDLVFKANFQVVISNTLFKANSALPFKSLAKLTVSDKELTLGGLMTPETLNAARAREVIEDEKSIDPYPKFKTLPDILLSHLGSSSDKALAKNEKFLKGRSIIIVGGHTHDAQVSEAHDTRSSLVVNTGAGGGIVVVRDGGKKAELLLSNDCPPSPEIGELISDYKLKYKEEINLDELAKTVFTIAENSETPSGLELKPNTTSHLRIQDSFMMRFTVDAIAESLRKNNHDVDFVLYPAASIRSNFSSNQEVTGMHLFETYYYSEKLVMMDLTGLELVHLLALGVMQGYKCCANRGQLLTPSEGLTYAYDVEQENPGHTITWVKKEGRFIDPKETFHIVTTDWIANEVKELDKITAKKKYPDDPKRIENEVTELCQAKAIKEYTDVPKIFKMVISFLQGRKDIYEKFGERIVSKQTPKYQADLMRKNGNSRGDNPGFNRYEVEINLGAHQANFAQEEPLSKSSPGTEQASQSFFKKNQSQAQNEDIRKNRYFFK